MTRAIDVARYLANLAVGESEPDPLTHLRLQKLLYYCQGWSLAQRGRPLFPETIEAWANGPVVRDVYRVFSGVGFKPILPEHFDMIDSTELDEGDCEFIASVWETYKQYSATRLRDLIHDEDPWIDARKGYGPADRCNEEISHDALRDYFLVQAS